MHFACITLFFIKAAVRRFSSVAISVRNLQLESFAELSILQCVYSVKLSVTVPVLILAFRITDYSFWKFDQYKNFPWKMSSELVRNIHFCSGSDIVNSKSC